jgi:hypothetical protein
MEGVEIGFIFWNKNGYDIQFEASCIVAGAQKLYTGSKTGEILIWEPTKSEGWEAS